MDANHFNANGIETVGIAVGYFNCHTGEGYLKFGRFLQMRRNGSADCVAGS